MIDSYITKHNYKKNTDNFNFFDNLTDINLNDFSCETISRYETSQMYKVKYGIDYRENKGFYTFVGHVLTTRKYWNMTMIQNKKINLGLKFSTDYYCHYDLNGGDIYKVDQSKIDALFDGFIGYHDQDCNINYDRSSLKFTDIVNKIEVSGDIVCNINCVLKKILQCLQHEKQQQLKKIAIDHIEENENYIDTKLNSICVSISPANEYSSQNVATKSLCKQLEPFCSDVVLIDYSRAQQ